uniref:RING-type domain-containing protein n=1 Tax=viral metagenome TaxID=1070528 RepID=A0A6C0BQY7_9ZZZZ
MDLDISYHELEYFRKIWYGMNILPPHYRNPALIAVTQQLLIYNQGRHPTLEEVLHAWAHELDRGCGCLEQMTLERRILFLTHLCQTYPGQVTCGTINVYRMFYAAEGRLPTPLELVGFCNNTVQLMINPDQYCQDNKLLTPTPNLNQLPTRITQNANVNCGICQETIVADSEVFVIPGCEHEFHSREEDCLGTSCILNWLRTNRKCPVCNQEVIISAPNNSKT